jgi:hypothetical protein
MRIIENKPVKMLFDDYMERTFPNEIDDDDFDQSDKNSFEENNPQDSVFVENYYEEIDDSPSHTWRLESDYYVCQVPDLDPKHQLNAQSAEGTYILFSISWDDNWDVYVRNIHNAATCDSHETAKTILLRKYAFDNLNNSGREGFRHFIEGILKSR